MDPFNQNSGPGDVYPIHSIQSEDSWTETEPLITPEKVKQLHLFGIPLVSGMIDPTTGKNQVLLPEQIAEHIDYAIGDAELETGLTIVERKFDQPVPFDPQEYKSYGFMQLPIRPISSVEEIVIKIANQPKLWTIPNQWVSKSHLVYGQLNILTVGIMGVLTESGNQQVIPDAAGNALLFTALFSKDAYWIPEMFRIKFTAGFPSNKIPKVVNNLIGTIAAMEILSLLASTYTNNSQSLSVGGLSESSSGPGPQRFDARLKVLEKKRAALTKKLRAQYQLQFFSSNV